MHDVRRLKLRAALLFALALAAAPGAAQPTNARLRLQDQTRFFPGSLGDMLYADVSGFPLRLTISADAGRPLVVSGGVPAWGALDLQYVTGILGIGRGGTDGTTASEARTNLGLQIGVDVQPFSADLSTLGSFSSDGFLVHTGSGWVVRTINGDGAGNIIVANPDGLADSPSISLSTLGPGTGGCTVCSLSLDDYGRVTSYADGSATGISSVNGLTGAALTLALSSTGSDTSITNDSFTNTITLGIPSASGSTRGLVTTSAQNFGGAKTFLDPPVISSFASAQHSHLDGAGGGTLDAAAIASGEVPYTHGGTGLSTAPDHSILVGSNTGYAQPTLPDCQDTTGNHLNYTRSTKTISCGTSGGGGGGSTPTAQTDEFTGDGATTIFSFSTTKAAFVGAYVDGLIQLASSYTENSGNITFGSAPATGSSIALLYWTTVPVGMTYLKQEFTAAGTDFVLTHTPTQIVSVTRGVQLSTSAWSLIAGTIVRLTTANFSGDSVIVGYFY